jgi:hypothetical protein
MKIDVIIVISFKVSNITKCHTLLILINDFAIICVN